LSLLIVFITVCGLKVFNVNFFRFLFNAFEISIEFCLFLTRLLMFLKPIFFGPFSTFYKFLEINALVIVQKPIFLHVFDLNFATAYGFIL
jgi:hypothetical protein